MLRLGFGQLLWIPKARNFIPYGKAESKCFWTQWNKIYNKESHCVKIFSMIDYIPSICHNGYDCTLHLTLSLLLYGDYIGNGSSNREISKGKYLSQISFL